MKLCINSIGLFLDLMGVLLLFFWTANGYKKVPPLFNKFGQSIPIIARTVEKLIEDLNSMIEEVNAENERRMKKSRCAIFVIIVGFILQLVSNFIT